MRDIAVTLIILGSVPFILKRPVIGIFMWVWVSIMSPHRLTWGFAYDQPFAMLIAIVTLVSIFINRDPGRQFPFTRTTVMLFLFVLWMNVSTLFAVDARETMPMWDKVMKTFLMLFVTMYVVREQQHVKVLAWIVTLSIGFYGVKGGYHVLSGGGEHRVYGPAGSFIEENNSLALATIVVMPLLLFLYHQSKELPLRGNMKRWFRWGFILAAMMSLFSVLGSHSRGGFLAGAAMLGFLWLKTKNKIVTGALMLLLVPFAVSFMPEKWMERMESIGQYEEDSSAQGRFNAWQMAMNLVSDRPMVGGGFGIYTEEVFARWAPNPTDVHAAHSIYFAPLGEHGYPGLIFFLLFWFFVWRDANYIIRNSRNREGWEWASELARMSQVGLIGYFVGGAFLSLAYYDMPYYIAVMIVLTRRLLEKEAPTKDKEVKGWYARPQPPPPVSTAAPGRRAIGSAGPPGMIGRQRK